MKTANVFLKLLCLHNIKIDVYLKIFKIEIKILPTFKILRKLPKKYEPLLITRAERNSATSVMLMELNAQFRVLTAHRCEIRQEFGQADKAALLLTALLNDTRLQKHVLCVSLFFHIIACGLIILSRALLTIISK
jgi:hypothetical protein